MDGLTPGWKEEEEDSATSLVALPDDVLLQIISACSEKGISVPGLSTVRGLCCLCWGVLKQLRRLQPLVGVEVRALGLLNPSDFARLACDGRGLWRVVILYTGALTSGVMEQARRGRLHLVDARGTTLAADVARHVVSAMLGAGCSLPVLGLSSVHLGGSWAATFGEEKVGSEVLRELHLDGCGLWGPIPELVLPALQILYLSNNELSGEAAL